MRRADYMASIVKQVGKLSTDALRYLDQWSFPWGVIPILKAYDDGELLRRVDCDMEVALAMEEIVRCRDCVAYEPYHTYAGMKLDYGECVEHRRQTNDDRFCWWAERSDR